MRVLIANLKLLCQCRKLWLVYPVLIALVWRYGPTVRGEGIELMDLYCFFFISGPVGAIVGGLMRQTLGKPFTYCLPGHRAMPRRVIFLVGLSWSLILAWLAIDHRGLSILESSTRMVALSSVGLTSYLWGVLFEMPSIGKVGPVSFYVAMLFFGVSLIWPEIPNALIRRVPAVFVIVALVVSVAVWRHLQTDACARALCAEPLDGLGDSHRSSRQKASRGRPAQSALPAWVEALFIARIDVHAVSSVARCMWGRLYLAFGRVLEAWWVVLLVVFLVTIYSGYEGRTADPEQAGLLGLWVAALALSFLTTLLPLSIRSDLLLPAGRRERFFAAFAVVGVTTVLVTGVLLFMATLAGALHSSAPAWFGRPQGVKCILFALALIPGFAIVNLFFSRPIGFQCTVYLGLGMLLVIAQMETHFMTIPVLLVASVCMWAVFVFLMHCICAKRCLVA